jgi:hypothetical protein
MNVFKEILQVEKDLLDIEKRLKLSMEQLSRVKFHLRCEIGSNFQTVVQEGKSLKLKRKDSLKNAKTSANSLKKAEKNHILFNNIILNNISKTIPPNKLELTQYCKERGSLIDPNEFYNFYQSKGWMIGKNRMKDWKAAVRTWEVKRRKDSIIQNKPPIYDEGIKYVWDPKSQKYRHSKSGAIYIP